MTVSVQQIYVRAKQSHPANADLVSIPSEILARVEADQQALFSSLAAVTRERFQTSASISSSSGASGRVFDLTALALSVERILTVTLADTREAREVDVMDLEAELSPRYIVRGRSLVEVSNDWGASGGIVNATIVYVYGPTSISPTGDFTQTITVPDEWADVLVLPLQMYFASQRGAKDDVAAIQAQLDDRTQAFVSYLTNYGGIRSNRFDVPTPTPAGKK